MTHLELENLASDYLEGQLDAVRRAEFEAHSAECAPCRELVADLRHTLELCRSAEDMEPAPWLVPKILLATIGEREPTFGEQLAAYFRPAARVRMAYAVAMAVFSFSIIVNTAGINLRHLTFEDLNPRTWIYQANRTGHLAVARAEKFYYDLRVVYEIESRLRQFQQQPGQGDGQQEKEAPKPVAPAGGTTDSKQPDNPELAEAGGLAPTDFDLGGTLISRPAETIRSSSR
ncbi:MAG: anti-sigma factor family protein [Terriglobia bacterium]